MWIKWCHNSSLTVDHPHKCALFIDCELLWKHEPLECASAPGCYIETCSTHVCLLKQGNHLQRLKDCFPFSRYECTRVQSLATQHHPRLLAFSHRIIDTETGFVLTVWRIERPLIGLIVRALPRSGTVGEVHRNTSEARLSIHLSIVIWGNARWTVWRA